jgi:hypothetical protein
MGNLPTNSHEIAVFIPDLPVFFQQTAGNKTGLKKTFQPLGGRQFSDIDRQF